MIHFPILRTRRFTVQLKELTIGQSIALAKMPPHLEQAETTAFLKYAVETCEGVSEDPSLWTVQERTLALCHYLAAISESGPDFAVGKNGHYSDYFDGSKDGSEPRPISVGTVGGDTWKIYDLLGRDAEIIETLQGELTDDKGEPIEGRAYWLFGAMAAQLRLEGEDKKLDLTSGEYETFVLDRMKVFASFPEANFTDLLLSFLVARKKLVHFFDIDFSSNGIVCRPMEAAADKNLLPGRFPVSACLNARALEVLGWIV